MAAVRKQDLVYFAGGRCLQRYGVWRKRTAPWEEIVETHERSDAAVSKGRDGVLRSTEAGVPRPHWVEDHNGILVPSYLLEGAGTNLILQSEDLSTTWTASNASVTTDDEVAPDGEATADLVEDSSGAAVGLLEQDVTVADDSEDRTVAVFVRKQSSFSATAEMFLRYSAGGTLVNYSIQLNPETGATDTSRNDAPTRADAWDWNDDWWLLWITAPNNGTGNTNAKVRLIPAINASGADGTLDASATGSAHFWGAGLYELPFPPSYIQTVASSDSRDADLLQESDVGFTPKDIEANGGCTILSELVDLGTAFAGGGNRYFQIGGAGANSDPRLMLRSSGSDGLVEAFWDDGTNTASTFVSAGTVSLTDHVRARVVIFLDGSNWKIQLHVSVNGGAETSATATTIGSDLPDSWSANTLTVGAAPDDTLHGYAAHIAHRFALGEHTLSEMEAAL